MRVSSLALLVALALPAVAPAQTSAARTAGTVRKHIVYFRDKTGTPFSVSQPQAFLSARAIQRRTRQNIAVTARDLPVNPAYVTQVKAVPGAAVWYTSRWFNAAVVNCDSATLAAVRALPFVRSATTLNRPGAGTGRPDRAQPTAAPDQSRAAAHPFYGRAYEQARMIGAVSMHNAGFRGEGVQIAVFDEGFPGVDQASQFASMRTENRLLDTYNFVERTSNVFRRGGHGTNCLSTMAGNQEGVYVGTAPKASYRLYITEDGSSENPIEEANWLLAAERADSAGVDVISSSLGYYDFDTAYGNYTYADMNGRTTLVSRAATVAARVGIVVVNSAGNEGNNAWRYIIAPADADSVLAVGAVDSMRVRAGFSSVGPSSDGRIKPNLAAQGRATAIVSTNGQVVRSNGTSFSCPVLAGMAAGFIQANPRLSAQQVIGFLQRSGSQYTNPDNLLGYGIPNFVTAYNLANPGNPLAAAAPGRAAELLAVYPNPAAGNELFVQLPAALRGAGVLRVRFYDLRGAVVAEQQLPASAAAEVRLRPGGLAQGVYTCEVQAGNGARRSTPFVKL